jgi:phenylalanyl-tRNA synthetase beta chain
LRQVQLFDLYEGKPIPAGKKSLAYHFIFQSPGKTLTDRVVRKNRQRIVKQLAHRLGAILREA